MADFGVTLGCDCWESLTTSGSGVSIVKNVDTCQRTDPLKKRRLGAAARLILEVVCRLRNEVEGSPTTCLLCLLGETLQVRGGGTWRQDGAEFGRSSQGSKNQTSGDWKTRGAVVPAFPVSERRRIYHTRQPPSRRGDHSD